ncbi:MAG: response regulator [Crocinitomicaceae bacterium]|nr:response regulator [Crocinitomicaceae bacterium]|tara:strand:- start:3137 stop:3499 length:363 start_codon:yes stop_codon:yes gene_type:complete
MKILLIEDERMLRESLVDLLEIDDHEVMFAENGNKGMKILQEFEPDIIITDVLMPEMDGYEVLMEVSNNPTYRHVPMIVISALVASDQIKMAKVFGASKYLTKPFSSQELRTAIAEVTQK